MIVAGPRVRAATSTAMVLPSTRGVSRAERSTPRTDMLATSRFPSVLNVTGDPAASLATASSEDGASSPVAVPDCRTYGSRVETPRASMCRSVTV
ncbi:hypothetical protein D3C74_362010 [compost metagenome]